MPASPRALLLLLVATCATSAWSASDVLCQTYIVKEGDSVWSIAAAHGLRQNELVSALEQCVGYTGTLSIGQKVCLANYVPACDQVIDSGGVANCKAYQIQQGDTLAYIASTFGIYLQDLQQLNQDSVGVLRPGTFVRLPPWNTATCPDPDSDAPSCRVYAVQAGDFAFGVASMFRVTLQALLDVNPGLQQGSVLQAGQRLRIPPFTAECGNGVLSTPPTTGVFNCRAYRVKQGDSLASIALLFQTTTASLVSVNPELANPSLLTPGYLVRIAPFPIDCLNGILIDPSGSAPATPAGPVTNFSPAPTPSAPSPSPMMSSPALSPSPVVTNPPLSPVVSTPSPSPSPVVVSPSPSPVPAGVAPSTGIKATLTFTGITATSVATSKAGVLASTVANLLGVPASWVSVSAAAATRRRLQAADATTVTVIVPTQQPTSIAAKLQSAAASGSLANLMTQLGLTMTPNSLTVTTYGTTTASPPPSPSPAINAPSPASSTANTLPATPRGGGSNVGAIVGGVVGGVVGACLVAGVVWFVIHRRRAAATAAVTGSGHIGGVTANISTRGGAGGMTIKTRAAHLAEDQAFSSSPRNTVTPRTRAANMA